MRNDNTSGRRCTVILKKGHVTKFYETNSLQEQVREYRMSFGPELTISGTVIKENNGYLSVLSDIDGIGSEHPLCVEESLNCNPVEKQDGLEHSVANIFHNLHNCTRPDFKPDQGVETRPSELSPVDTQYKVEIYQRDILMKL